MKRGRRVGEQRARRVRERGQREGEARRRLDELDAVVRGEQPPLAAMGEDDAAALAADARLDEELARLRDRPTVLDRILDVAGVIADGETIAAEAELQSVLDRLHARTLPKPALAALAHAVNAQLAALELELAGAREARADAVRAVDTWTDLVATAVREERPDLAEQARERLASYRASVVSSDAVLFEYAELRDQLLDLGRLVLEAARSVT